MTWHRVKKSRSSALPVTREHNGVHIIVTPAPDSDHGQNTGISGTRHTVAGTESADGKATGLEPVARDPADDRDDEERRGTGIEILGTVTADVPADLPEADLPEADLPEAAAQEPPRLNQPVTGTAPQPASEDNASHHRPFGGFWQAGDGADPADGDQAQRTRVRDLTLDARVRLWRLRVLIMLVVGVVFSIIVDWPTGITLAVLAGIADTVYRSRTVASAPPPPGKLDRAQRSTQKQLAKMYRAGYLAWHARPIPGSMEVIDHLVIGPTGVYAIDSEKWEKKMPIRTRNGKQLWHGPESKKERLEHARWEAGQASERLSAALGRDIPVRPAMAVYGPGIPWDIATIREVDVFSGDRLRKYLQRRARMKTVPRLSPDEVRKIHEVAGKVMPLAPTRTATPVG
jgi:hypothetical protein